ncbi:MAG: hypothetical protein H8E24_00995 [Verrucomicrobia bacterium]|nr:hypothetical protein [Verrucomicrobiota bacterium]
MPLPARPPGRTQARRLQSSSRFHHGRRGRWWHSCRLDELAKRFQGERGVLFTTLADEDLHRVQARSRGFGVKRLRLAGYRLARR